MNALPGLAPVHPAAMGSSGAPVNVPVSKRRRIGSSLFTGVAVAAKRIVTSIGARRPIAGAARATGALSDVCLSRLHSISTYFRRPIAGTIENSFLNDSTDKFASQCAIIAHGQRVSGIGEISDLTSSPIGLLTCKSLLPAH
jgi:hypothetical protein